jgi:hypothetical protein
MTVVKIVRPPDTVHSRLVVEILPCLLEMTLNKGPVIGEFLLGVDA